MLQRSTIRATIVRFGLAGLALGLSTASAWAFTASEHRGKIGQTFTYDCPAGVSGGTVWGTGVYTDDSEVCNAAIHDGRIDAATGGKVTVEILPGQESYQGTEQRGVASNGYGAWGGSFAFVGAGSGSPAEDCFAEDPGAGLTSREPHLEWAQDKSGAELIENLNYKLDLLERCPLSEDELELAFGSLSRWIAARVRDPACFGGDTGVLNESLDAHREWAQQRPPTEFMANLRWKTGAAMQCLDPAQQRELFADLSYGIALAPLEQP